MKGLFGILDRIYISGIGARGIVLTFLFGVLVGVVWGFLVSLLGSPFLTAQECTNLKGETLHGLPSGAQAGDGLLHLLDPSCHRWYPTKQAAEHDRSPQKQGFREQQRYDRPTKQREHIEEQLSLSLAFADISEASSGFPDDFFSCCPGFPRIADDSSGVLR